MNVGEWLAMQAASIIGLGSVASPKSVSVAYTRPHDNAAMIEISPNCYLNKAAFEAGIHKMKVRVITDSDAPLNVPVGNSLTPWRIWLEKEGKEWSAKWSWL